MPKAGVKAKCYVKVGQNWVMAKLIQDLTVAFSMTEISIKNKGSEFEKFIPGVKLLPIDFPMSYEETNEVFLLLRKASYDGTVVEFLTLDKKLDQPNAFGISGKYIVTKFEKSEPVDGEMIANVSLRLDANSDDPVFVTTGTDGGDITQIHPPVTPANGA